MVSRKNNTRKKGCVYDANDFNDKNGMLTAIWGPGMWHFLHTMSFNYPNQPSKLQKKQYKDFVISLKHILPCGKCRENLAINFKKMPLTMKHMKNRETFSRYVYELHEMVNKQLNKHSGLTYEMVRERYEHFRARCVFPKKNKTRKKNEKGCVVPLYGEKAKCVLHIVPQEKKCDTLQIDEKCIKKKLDV
jgi:hypothetical protein|tara:strand:+ start:106 stop:675 length:570 start_codon:yes stop_codon:yes gene_type:complete